MEMVRLLVLSAGLMAAVLMAQVPAVSAESAATTASQSRGALDKFVNSFAAPTRQTGKLPRWENGICPLTVGQGPDIARYVTQHVKDVATTVDAPVSADPSCTPNIEIIFTATPQDLLDNVRAHDADYLGYSESSAERERLAKVTRPIQAWYMTQTRDLRGMSRIDSGRSRGAGASMANFTDLPCIGCRGRNDTPIDLPNAGFASVSGNRTSDGMRSVLHHILIVVDPAKVTDYGIGALADYIAMLALTQINSLDTCQQLPSIVNSLAPGCEQKADRITENDLAYLNGLYSMKAEKNLAGQQRQIADTMKDTLGRSGNR